MVGMHKFVCVEDNHYGFLYTRTDEGVSLMHDVGEKTWMGWLGSPEAYDTTTYFFHGDTPEEALEQAGLLESKRGGERLKESVVAETIWSQIGIGTKMACGARDRVNGERQLTFRVGAGNPAQWIRVTLDGSDTYTVELLKKSKSGGLELTLPVSGSWRNVTLSVVDSQRFIYADMIDEVVYRLVNK